MRLNKWRRMNIPEPGAIRGTYRPSLGFTLIELMAVIAIILVLVGLTAGALANAQFKARVTSCSNNYRQWGIAVAMYASEDPKGRLPAYSLPLSKLVKYGDLLPWFVSLEMGTNMTRYGLTPPLWFCPARPDGLNQANAVFRSKRDRSIATMEDLTEYWTIQYKVFAGIDHSWFVPRPLEGSSEIYPDPAIVKARVMDGWPRRSEDSNISTQPILTDIAIGSWNDNETEFTLMGQGHQFPKYFFKNLNELFFDGHVETKSKAAVKWQFRTTGAYVIVY